MIVFLYGKDTYRSFEKLQEIINQHKSKYESSLNMEFFDEKSSFKEVLDCSKQFSMFTNKRLVIINGGFSAWSENKEFMKSIDKLKDSEDVFVFREEELLKSKIKKIENKKQAGKVMIQEFPILSKGKLFNWTKNIFIKNGVEIEDDAVSYILEIGGDNLWRIKTESEKLSLHKKKITKKDAELLIKIETNTDIFKTIDAIGEKNKEKALSFIYDHLEKEDHPLYLFSMIVFQFRNLIVVKDLKERKIDYNQAKTKSGMHPFVFQKSYRQAEKFTFQELKKLYKKLFELDLKAKTGQIEPVMALHLFIFEC
jgi:DNA polymerase III subunit delta